MNNQVELERYWHWFHGLFGISQKEKEGLLNICPKVEVWYEFAKKQKTSELFLYKQEELKIEKKETEKQKERREEQEGELSWYILLLKEWTA